MTLRSQIIHCLTQVETLIDFGDGEDIEEGVFEQGINNQLILLFMYRQLSIPARTRTITLLSWIQKHLSDNRRGEVFRSGIAIFGRPNAGKK